jgi:hypothetical protein
MRMRMRIKMKRKMRILILIPMLILILIVRRNCVGNPNHANFGSLCRRGSAGGCGS